MLRELTRTAHPLDRLINQCYVRTTREKHVYKIIHPFTNTSDHTHQLGYAILGTNTLEIMPIQIVLIRKYVINFPHPYEVLRSIVESLFHMKPLLMQCMM